MSKLKFYCIFGWPSRNVIYLAEHLGINLHVVNMDSTLTSREYIEVNPTWTTILYDDGIRIYGSSAIMIYLVEKYGETDDLYPKDLVQRAKINSMLFFETQFLFGRLRAAVEPFFETSIPNPFGNYLLDKINDSLDRLERVLYVNDTDFIVGNSITICDFTYIATVLSMEVFVKFDDTKYPKIGRWLNRLYKKFPKIKRIEKQNSHEVRILLHKVNEINGVG